MSDPLLEARGVRLAFAGRQVLDGVDLTVSAGEIVTLIGPNGAGKSTLVRVLLGLVRADAGEVYRRPGLTIGYMPQRLTLDPVLPLTVRRFLQLAGRGLDDGRLQAALDEVGAGHVLANPIQQVSGGELQRVLLARALLREPQLLVLDEPVQGVDVTGQSELYALIADLRRRRHCGVLMVSHDLHLVMAATDSVVCLNTHVCCSGHPESVSRHPAYLKLFGPREAATLAVYTHHHDHIHEVDGHVHEVPDQEHRHG